MTNTTNTVPAPRMSRTLADAVTASINVGVYAGLHGLTVSQDTRNELVQASWQKFLTQSVDPQRGDAGALACAIGRTTAQSYVRGDGRWRAEKAGPGRTELASIDAAIGEEGAETIGTITPSREPSPYMALVIKRRRVAMAAALATLSDDERAVLIGEEEDRPMTVAERVRASRARDKLECLVKASL